MLNLATTVGVPAITASSPTTAMRKAYLKLSLLIHPDKLSKHFADAAKAFQALVRAFERLSCPSYATDFAPATGKDKVVTIARSNEGCHRTRVCCPRCIQPWSEGTLDGSPLFIFNYIFSVINWNQRAFAYFIIITIDFILKLAPLSTHIQHIYCTREPSLCVQLPHDGVEAICMLNMFVRVWVHVGVAQMPPLCQWF
jgi:DnaJ domain